MCAGTVGGRGTAVSTEEGENATGVAIGENRGGRGRCRDNGSVEG